MKLLTTAQAAEFLCVSQSTLEAMRLSGRGPTYIKVGKLVRYSTEQIEEWLDTNKHTSTSCMK